MLDGLTETEKRVLAVIPSGADNAVPCPVVERLTGFDRRVVHEIVYQLNLSGVIVASSRRGYFIPETPSEWREYFGALSAAHVQRAQRLKAIRAAAEKEGIDLG